MGSAQKCVSHDRPLVMADGLVAEKFGEGKGDDGEGSADTLGFRNPPDSTYLESPVFPPCAAASSSSMTDLAAEVAACFCSSVRSLV